MSSVPGNSGELSEYERAEEAAATILRAAPAPRVGVVLGTGLGSLADAIEAPVAIPFTSIPHFLPATVPGHVGQVVLGAFAGAPVALLRGRIHLYEGYTPQQITFPIRVFSRLGIEVCILTNAAGGLNSALPAGSLLLIRDHIGLPALAGLNPLTGLNDDRFGVRFPSMVEAYDPGLRQAARDAAQRNGIALAEGVYVMVGGPSFETQAELRMLRTLGADAVGMSTVPEVIVARHMGMRVLAISTVTNLALADTGVPEEPDHEEVMRTAEAAAGRLTTLLHDVVALIR